MTHQTSLSYPGSTAAPDEILALADEYRRAAHALIPGRKGAPLSRAPGRLCAIHAIELYLNVFLLTMGAAPKDVRGHLHNLSALAEKAIANGLVLRKRTANHLRKLTDDREYLVSRYGPELTATLSQTNRLLATLDEVARKTRANHSLALPKAGAQGSLGAGNMGGPT